MTALRRRQVVALAAGTLTAALLAPGAFGQAPAAAAASAAPTTGGKPPIFVLNSQDATISMIDGDAPSADPTIGAISVRTPIVDDSMLHKRAVM